MDNTSNGMPQFGTAEFTPANAGPPCAGCKKPLQGSFYRVNGMQACEKCMAQLKAQIPQDSHAAFVRAVLFGIGGALVGLALYAIVGIATGLEIGYVALAVGFIVGKAMHFGSKGVGGRRYQIVAVILTYLAVSVAAVPMGIYALSKQGRAEQHATQSSEPAAAEPKSEGTDQPAAQSNGSAPAQSNVHIKVQQLNVGKVVIGLLVIGVASPFLQLQNPMSGIIGLIILFVGIRFAWNFTAGPRLDITGPHPVQAAATNVI